MLESLELYFKNNSLHHAYLVEGEPEALSADILALIKESGIKIEGNPDVTVERYSTFTIADGRALKSRQGEKAITGTKKFFIIQTNFFNIEAQHALLKIFEEPADDVHFFILTSRADSLLDTLASRLVHIRSNNREIKNDSALIFLKKTKSERLKEVAKIIKAHEDDEDSGLLRGDAINLLNGIESVLHEKLSIKDLKKDERALFEQIGKSRMYLNTPGASVKILLESIALLAPEI